LPQGDVSRLHKYRLGFCNDAILQSRKTNVYLCFRKRKYVYDNIWYFFAYRNINFHHVLRTEQF
jgi:hypothetical protein